MTESTAMTRAERHSSLSITFIYALRMLGLFLVLPVFSLEAAKIPGGTDPVMVGLGMGIYGLTQGIFQTPFGILSDSWGRKRTILIGLVIFVLGSIACAEATTMTYLILGRCLQGAGAISAATSALLSDQTRSIVRTKAMAMVGISIALMFALSLVAAPLLTTHMGLSGLFWIVAILAVIAIVDLYVFVPSETRKRQLDAPHWTVNLKAALRDKTLLRLNLGVFILHAVQLSMWMAVPQLILKAGIGVSSQWTVYLPAVVVGFLIMGGCLFRLERKGYLRGVYLSSIALLAIIELLFALVSHFSVQPTYTMMLVLLLVFFTGFNTLEAMQPSWVSRQATEHNKGAALGIYNSVQSLGIFVGGLVGGFLVSHLGAQALFSVAFVALIIWLITAWSIKAPAIK